MLTEQDYAEILSDAEERYDDDVRSVACGIARLAFAENGIDKNTARTMALPYGLARRGPAEGGRN